MVDFQEFIDTQVNARVLGDNSFAIDLNNNVYQDPFRDCYCSLVNWVNALFPTSGFFFSIQGKYDYQFHSDNQGHYTSYFSIHRHHYFNSSL